MRCRMAWPAGTCMQAGSHSVLTYQHPNQPLMARRHQYAAPASVFPICFYYPPSPLTPIPVPICAAATPIILHSFQAIPIVMPVNCDKHKSRGSCAGRVMPPSGLPNRGPSPAWPLPPMRGGRQVTGGKVDLVATGQARQRVCHAANGCVDRAAAATSAGLVVAEPAVARGAGAASPWWPSATWGWPLAW